MRSFLFVYSAVVLALLPRCAELGSWVSKEELASEALRIGVPGLAEMLDESLPVVPPSRTRFPTKSDVPKPSGKGAFWKRLADGTFRFAPGSYRIPVHTWCMKASGSSPDAHRYTLARLSGKATMPLRDLAARALRERRIRLSEIQYLSWKIQAGLTLEEMDERSRAIVASLIPEHVAALRQSPYEQLRERWNALARATGGETWESVTGRVLDRMGDWGDAVRVLRETRTALRNRAARYETFRERIGLPGRVGGSAGSAETPWSELEPGVYARFLTQSHYMRGGVLEIRVLEAAVAGAPRVSLPWAGGSRGADASGAGMVALDISSLVADPGVGNVQPLGMTPLLGVAAAPFVAVESPFVAAAFLAALAGAAVATTDWDALAKALAAGGAAASEVVQDLLNEIRNLSAVPGYIPPPAVPSGIPGLERAKPKTPVQGGGGLRKRWKDRDGNIYEWDGQHGKVEKYDPRGRHQGEYDPDTGEQTKPKDNNRRVEP